MIKISKKVSAIVKVNIDSERISVTIQKALEPETKASITNRSKVKIICKENTIILFFKAKDTTALRASINSYLNWLKLLQDTFNLLKT